MKDFNTIINETIEKFTLGLTDKTQLNSCDSKDLILAVNAMSYRVAKKPIRLTPKGKYCCSKCYCELQRRWIYCAECGQHIDLSYLD